MPKTTLCLRTHDFLFHVSARSKLVARVYIEILYDGPQM